MSNPVQKMDPEKLRSERMAQLAENARKLRNKNIFTGVTIGCIALGIYGYTFYSISQEKFLDDLENEAEAARANYPKTSAN